jgi:hypothetical protein
MVTNGSTDQPGSMPTWSARQLPGFAFQTSNGVALEYMIQLSNALHEDAWFTLPHDLDDDGVRAFATTVRDQLDPSLHAWVEYSNETWNATYNLQSTWVQDHGVALGLATDRFEAGQRYTGLRSSQIFALWQSVFGSLTRFVRLVSAQFGSDPEWGSAYVVAGTTPGTVDALSVGPYFECTPELLYTTSGATQFLQLSDTQVLDRCQTEISTTTRATIQKHLDLARANHLRLVGYESGQSLVGVGPVIDNSAVTTRLTALNRNPRMHDLYIQYFTQWHQMVGDQINHLSYAELYGRYGSWGSMEWIDQPFSDIPKYRALTEMAPIMNPVRSGTSLTPGPQPIAGYSWDSGLFAQIAPDNSSVHSWGVRQTQGFWGTGPVNYQSGGTRTARSTSAGNLTLTMQGTYCPNGQCSYGSGSGYKGLVQLWNDSNNYIAFGLIHDPGVSPNGITIMVEGAGSGRPLGGYWSAGAISGASHTVSVQWNYSGVTFTLDGSVTLGPYPVAASSPSISLLAAARGTGDIADTTFTNIWFA